MEAQDREMISSVNKLDKLASLFTKEEIYSFISIFWGASYISTFHRELSTCTSGLQALSYIHMESKRVYAKRLKTKLGIGPSEMMAVLLTPFSKIPIKLSDKEDLVQQAYRWRLKIGK